MNETVKKYLKVGGILGLIAGASAAIICTLNVFTEPKIKENEFNAQQAALAKFYPDAKKYSEELSLKDAKATYVLSYWKAFDAEDLVIGNVYKTSGRNAYGAITMLVGVSKGEIGKIVLVTNTETYADTIVEEYLDPYNKGARSLDDTKCGATKGAELIRAMAKEAQSVDERLNSKEGQ
ncbi:MAG: hypothetical protein K5694_04775 [Bacilli bacterium]|nr:hypothetical protein [Bacilli bacterium]